MVPSPGFSEQAVAPPPPRPLLLPKDSRRGGAVVSGTGERSLHPRAASANGMDGPPREPRPWGLGWELVPGVWTAAANPGPSWDRRERQRPLWCAAGAAQGTLLRVPQSVEAAEPTLWHFSGVKSVLSTSSGFFRGPKIFVFLRALLQMLVAL